MPKVKSVWRPVALLGTPTDEDSPRIVPLHVDFSRARFYPVVSHEMYGTGRTWVEQVRVRRSGTVLEALCPEDWPEITPHFMAAGFHERAANPEMGIIAARVMDEPVLRGFYAGAPSAWASLRP